MLTSSSRDARTLREWFQLIHDAAAQMDGGLTNKDMREYLDSKGELLDGVPIDEGDIAQRDALTTAFLTSARWLELAKLVEVKMERDLRKITPNIRLTPLPEHTIYLREGANLLRRQSEAKMLRRFFRLLALHRAKGIAAKIKGPLAIISATFAILKFALQWNTTWAAVTAAIVAVLAAIAAALPAQH